MTIYAIQYRYVSDADLLAKYRPEHRAYNRKLNEQGIVLSGGPLVDAPGAFMIYHAENQESAEAALNDDPFWIHGCIEERILHEWTPVVGAFSK
ncbi:MAG: YciI family protein [Microbacteriaceae bacterium]|jgi:uncharacterized protein YciI|nr:YciI family protein [Microbacteriaceae bacterium]MCI1207645.1 YciI family protein [Microbacteriaceae bacterium]